MRVLRVVLMMMAVSGIAVGQAAQKPSDAAQTSASGAAAAMPEAKAEDVKSPEAIVKALYDVISGPAGERDWNRFKSLFIPEGRLIFNGLNPKGEYSRRVMTTDDYQQRAGGFFMKEGFFESGVSNTVNEFGHIANVFSTYESRHEKGEKPFARGINSIQLASDGKRWYVVEILWDAESDKNPIPQKYLK